MSLGLFFIFLRLHFFVAAGTSSVFLFANPVLSYFGFKINAKNNNNNNNNKQTTKNTTTSKQANKLTNNQASKQTNKQTSK
jgi:uncharacterized membrane protein